MKSVIITAIFFLPLLSIAQYETFGDFTFQKDTVIFSGHKIVPGDTLQLGWGSGTNKDFLFVYNYNGLPLSHIESNSILVFKKVESKKSFGMKTVTPVFAINGSDKLKVLVLFTNAEK